MNTATHFMEAFNHVTEPRAKPRCESAYGKEGILLNPYHTDGKWVLRVYDQNGSFIDYDVAHSDLCVKIVDTDAYFYSDANSHSVDHSPATLGIDKHE